MPSKCVYIVLLYIRVNDASTTSESSCSMACTQVLGDGDMYKRPWLAMFRRKRRPRNPSIMSLVWSSDSYQLASLDASSTIRIWWNRPEPGGLFCNYWFIPAVRMCLDDETRNSHCIIGLAYTDILIYIQFVSLRCIACVF